MHEHGLLRTSLLIAGVSLGAVSAALAQTAPPSGTTALPEIVITAQKRTEKLSDAPVAASVVATAQLAQTDSTDISDLNKIVPSVELNGSFNGRVPMGVRGISSVSNESTVGIASGVEVLVDGVPVPSDSMSGNALEDVARVEVLKGPQSTLGGRTASAGEISVITFGPTAHYQGGASLTVTDDDEQHFIAHVSGPINDQLQFSLAGWTHHLTYPIKNLDTGQNSYSDNWGVRTKLKYKPVENFDAELALHFGEMESHGSNFVYTYVTPGANLLCGLSCPSGWPLTQAAMLGGAVPSLNNQNYASPVTTAGAHLDDADGQLTLNYYIGGYTISSTTAYQRERQKNVQDLFAVDGFFFQTLCGCNVFLNTQTQTETIQQTTEELKIVSPANRRFSYVAGLFYSDSQVDEHYLRTLPPAAEDLYASPDTRTVDVYARGMFKLTDRTSITAGLRYNYDMLQSTVYQAAFAQSSPQSCATVSGSVVSAYPCYVDTHSNSDAVVGDISLEQKLTPSTMVYFTYSRGYAPAVYNTSLALTALNNPTGATRTGPEGLSYLPADVHPPVGQEHINSFELGSKGAYFDRRLTLNVALFDTVYDNYQIQSFSSEPGVLNSVLVLANTGAAETRGLEVDANAQPTNLLTLGFSAALIEAKFTHYPDAPCWVGQTTGCAADSTGSEVQNIAGKALPNSPKFKFNFSASQMIPLDSMPFDLQLAGNFSYRTKAQMLPDQNPQAVEPAFGLLDLSMTMLSKDRKYSVTLFVNNVTDKHYLVDLEDFWAGPWGSNAVIGQPARDAHRFGGIQLSAKY